MNVKFKNKFHIFFAVTFTGHGADSTNQTEEALKLIRRSLKSNSMDRVEGTHFDGNYPHIFIVFGASVGFQRKFDFFNLFYSNVFLWSNKLILGSYILLFGERQLIGIFCFRLHFSGRFGKEEDLSNIVVAFPWQLIANRNDFLWIRKE